MKTYRVPAKETRAELIVVNSRFIATIAPVSSIDEAKLFIRKTKEEFSDASHNVPAYVIGHGSSVIAHCNDDGEPSGTAGKPALAVLQGSGLGDVAVVVTRYFGGTKLGKGGLVRAYSDAVRAVLKVVPIAEKVQTHTAMMVIPYSIYERVKKLIQENKGVILDEDFGGDITITGQFLVDIFPIFQAALTEMTHGGTTLVIISTNENTIIPINVAEP